MISEFEHQSFPTAIAWSPDDARIAFVVKEGIQIRYAESGKIQSSIDAEIEGSGWVSFCCRNGEQLQDGSKVEDALRVVGDLPQVVAVGVNCTAPEFISELIEVVRGTVPEKGIIMYPNSGEVYQPDSGTWLGTSDPDDFVLMAGQAIRALESPAALAAISSW